MWVVILTYYLHTPYRLLPYRYPCAMAVRNPRACLTMDPCGRTAAWAGQSLRNKSSGWGMSCVHRTVPRALQRTKPPTRASRASRILGLPRSALALGLRIDGCVTRRSRIGARQGSGLGGVEVVSVTLKLRRAGPAACGPSR
jgi:hypothetical protein